MEGQASLLTSFIGIAIFSAVMYLIYRYANGNVAFKDELQKAKYLQWQAKWGTALKGIVIILSIIYGFAMLIQLISLM